MVMTLRKRSAQCVCDNLSQFNAERLCSLPPYILNQLHDLMCRRSLTEAASSLVVNLVGWATLRVDWSNFDTISDDSILNLAGCRSLQTLSLNAMKGSRVETPSSKALLTVLPHLSGLRDVQLRRCSQVDDAVVDALTAAAGRNLRVLNLQDCPACTDASLRFIAERCSALSSLNISGCSITDAGVASLTEARLSRQLMELQINRCSDITDASISRLVDGCPRLKILTFTNCPLLTAESRIALERLQSPGGVKQLFWTVY